MPESSEFLRTWCWDLEISREKGHHVHFRVRKCSLSEYELYSEPVVVSVFLAIIYCLYNSLMPVNLKKECACTLPTLHKKNCQYPSTFIKILSLDFQLN